MATTKQPQNDQRLGFLMKFVLYLFFITLHPHDKPPLKTFISLQLPLFALSLHIQWAMEA